MTTWPTFRNAIGVVGILLLLGAGASSAGASSPGEPWRLGAQLGLPQVLSITAQHRVRYGYLHDQFRATRTGSGQMLALRTLLHVRLDVTDGFTAGVELMDSRAYLADSSIAVSTAHVNAVELLQAYGSFTAAWPWGGSSNLRFGRITMDVGSRRFVARNRFRNTLNAFTGVDWEWKGDKAQRLRAFYTLPVLRLPRIPIEARNNEIEIDEESFNVNFWGLHYGAELPWGDRGEIYIFGLHEKDAPERPTRNRQIFTPGFRILRQAKTGELDYEIETALQFGDSRLLASGLGRDLDHFAHFHHAELGYTFDAPWSPRLVAQYDYASGDDDPNDGANGRFDTLYGARRFDFGPTGIYGPFARSNINTPGVRLQLRPAPRVTTFLAFRAYWLASKRDFWTTSGVRDVSGNSGSFVGSQVEMRLRWEVVPGNVRLETGVAHLFAGEFMNNAPNSNGQGDATYVYTQLVFNL